MDIACSHRQIESVESVAGIHQICRQCGTDIGTLRTGVQDVMDEDFITADEAEARWPEIAGKTVPEHKDADGNVWVREVVPSTDPGSSMVRVTGYRRKK